MKKGNILLIIIFVIIDLISKVLISNYLFDDSVTIINNFFNITYAKNTGVAFSFLEGNRFLIIIVTLIMVMILINYLCKNKVSNIERVAFSLIIGGATGNLIDRIVYGYVIDFFDFKIFGYDYPIFNIADSFIVIGVMILLFISINKDVGDRCGNNSRK